MTNRGRQLYCRRCEGHGKKNTLRGHGAVCPYIDCDCRSCSRLMKMRKSAFLRRYKEILPESESKTNTSMAEQLVSEYKLIDGTNPRLRFTNTSDSMEIANPKPLKICDFKETLMQDLTPTISQLPIGSLMNQPSIQSIQSLQNLQNLQHLMNFNQISQQVPTSLMNLSNNVSSFTSLPNPLFQQQPFQQYNMTSHVQDQKPFLMQMPNSYQLAYFHLINSVRMNKT